MKVFITGASSGIGLALARHYLDAGHTVGLFARRGELLATLAAAHAPERVGTYVGDVRDPAALAAAGRGFEQRFGPADVVIANAGVSRGTDTALAEDMPAFAEVLAINVLGIVHTFAPFVAGMRARGAGQLVGIASVAGFRGLPGSGAYSASKAAAITYLESLRVELAGSGVAVTTICPGFVATPMTARNPYRMPFLTSPERAARSIARAIERRKRFHVFPLPMALVGYLLRRLPRPLYDAAMARAPRKPRRPV